MNCPTRNALFGMARCLLLALALTLGGCFAAHQPNASGFTDEQQVYYNYFITQGFSKDKATMLAVVPVARQLYFDDQKCQSYGAKPGSDAYVACRAQLEAGNNRPPTAAQPSGGGYYPQATAAPVQEIQPMPNILPPTVRCQSVPAGLGTVQTVCR